MADIVGIRSLGRWSSSFPVWNRRWPGIIRQAMSSWGHSGNALACPAPTSSMGCPN